MFRLLKALPLGLAIAALSLVTISCGSNTAKARFVNAIQNTNSYGGPGSTIDVFINKTKVFSSLGFPSSSGATYTSVAAGSDTFEGFESPADTIPVFNNLTTTLSGGNQYTIVAAGSVASAPVLLTPHDINTAPTAGNVQFRFINASPSGPEGCASCSVDIYILPEPVSNPFGTPQIASLAYQQTSAYYNIAYDASGWGIFVTPHGSTTTIINTSYVFGSQTTSSIRTLVLVDAQNSSQMSNSVGVFLADYN